MKKIILILCLLASTAHAFEFSSLMDTIKTKINKIIGKSDEKVEIITMPKIPKVVKDATSIAVYSKNGEIHAQGKKYNSLSLDQKRKYRLAFVEELYIVVNDAEATKEQLASMLNVLEKGGSREGLYRSLVLSNDYASLEGYEESPKDKLVDFSAKLAEKYLNKVFDKKVLVQFNLYGLKKVMTEKMLEITDVFASDGKDLRSWYAVFSSDLAREYPQLWQGPIRGNTAREVHYKWAQGIPLQHIKSELIIKLHRAMNYLQN